MPEQIAPGVVEIEHTADLGMEVVADSLPELFHRAGVGMMALVRDRAAGAEAGSRRTGPAEASKPPPGARSRLVELERDGADVPGLLVRWLRELLYLQEVDGFVYGAAEFDRLDASGLRVRVHAAPDPAPAIREIKGVTYHGLEVEQQDDAWRARVIFDI